MDPICLKCKDECATFAQFCPGVEKWTCDTCREAREEAEKRYAKWENGGNYHANSVA